MSESARTALYLATALAVTALAVVTRPGRVQTPTENELVGKPLFPAFKEPFSAKRMQIVEFNEALSEAKEFEVSQKDGRWVIPSHNDYPADAQERLKKAATALVDLKVIRMASERATDHALYGVVEPTMEKSETAARGVGTLVRMRDESDNKLADIVIGKKVKGSETQRFVRVAGNQFVFTAEIDPEEFSTKFEDWIEKDLLKLNAMDVSSLTLKDYSITEAGVTQTGALAVNPPEQRSEFTVNWNADRATWELVEMLDKQDDQLAPSALRPGEELNKETLDAVKNALDDLKIMDVEKKPGGLGENLKAATSFLEDRQSINSLIDRGFYPLTTPDDQVELLSSEGEVSVQTKDAVEYVLRFGKVASVDTDKDKKGSLNRFVFVTARVDDASLPEPNLEPLPGEATAPTEQPQPLNEAEQQNEEKQPAQADDKDNENETASDADKKSALDAKPADKKENSPDAAERERIVKENQRKLDEYKEKRRKAEEKVAELNYRFADWYYVVSEEVFQKIHPSRDEVVKTIQKPGENPDIDTFRNLENQGLQRSNVPAAPQNGDEDRLE